MQFPILGKGSEVHPAGTQCDIWPKTVAGKTRISRFISTTDHSGCRVRGNVTHFARCFCKPVHRAGILARVVTFAVQKASSMVGQKDSGSDSTESRRSRALPGDRAALWEITGGWRPDLNVVAADVLEGQIGGILTLFRYRREHFGTGSQWSLVDASRSRIALLASNRSTSFAWLGLFGSDSLSTTRWCGVRNCTRHSGSECRVTTKIS